VICVIGYERDAVRAGAALATRLRPRGGTAVVSTWGAAVPAGSELATGAALRCARRLREEGHDARAAGRLVHVALPATPEHALAAAERVAAAISQQVHVVVLAGPRDVAFDPLVRTANATLVVRSRRQPGGLAELARTALGDLCSRTAILDIGAGRPPGVITAAGLLLAPRLRAAVAQALGAAGALPGRSA
jgi:hypothetical protein